MAKFVQSKHYTPGPRGHVINLVVLHTMESQEKPDTAETVAAWFAGASAPQSSIHWCVDSNSKVQCVKDADIAWHSGHWPTNQRSLGIELAGTAKQSKREWADAYSRGELQQAADLVAIMCYTYKIPPALLTPAQVRAGKAGLCGHVDVTKAFTVAGGHTDPGPNFPWAAFLPLVKTALAKLEGKK